MCARLRAQIFDHTHQYVKTPTYSAYINAIIQNVAAILACHSYGMLLLISIIMMLIYNFNNNSPFV